MTPTERDALKKLVAAATEGPWKVNYRVVGGGGGWPGSGETVVCGPRDKYQTIPGGDVDRDFIAAARTAIPQLLDALDAAEVTARDDVFSLLVHHWPSVICDHATKTDKAQCSCSSYEPPVMPTVGEAVRTWIDHVRGLADGSTPRPAGTPISSHDTERTAREQSEHYRLERNKMAATAERLSRENAALQGACGVLQETAKSLRGQLAERGAQVLEIQAQAKDIAEDRDQVSRDHQDLLREIVPLRERVGELEKVERVAREACDELTDDLDDARLLIKVRAALVKVKP